MHACDVGRVRCGVIKNSAWPITVSSFTIHVRISFTNCMSPLSIICFAFIIACLQAGFVFVVRFGA